MRGPVLRISSLNASVVSRSARGRSRSRSVRRGRSIRCRWTTRRRGRVRGVTAEFAQLQQQTAGTKGGAACGKCVGTKTISTVRHIGAVYVSSTRSGGPIDVKGVSVSEVGTAVRAGRGRRLNVINRAVVVFSVVIHCVVGVVVPVGHNSSIASNACINSFNCSTEVRVVSRENLNLVGCSVSRTDEQRVRDVLRARCNCEVA